MSDRLPHVDAGDVRAVVLEARNRGYDVPEDAARMALLLEQLSEHELRTAAALLFPEPFRDPPPELLDPTIPLDLRVDAWLHRSARLG